MTLHPLHNDETTELAPLHESAYGKGELRRQDYLLSLPHYIDVLLECVGESGEEGEELFVKALQESNWNEFFILSSERSRDLGENLQALSDEINESKSYEKKGDDDIVQIRVPKKVIENLRKILNIWHGESD